jgi:hypothetical protein
MAQHSWVLVLTFAPVPAIELRKEIIGSFGTSNGLIPGVFQG